MRPIPKVGVERLSAMIERKWWDGRSLAVRRDALMMGLGLLGLRCCEVLRVRRKDWTFQGHTLMVRTAKRGRRRTITVGASWSTGVGFILRYGLDGDPDDLLFRTRNGNAVAYEQALRRCREWTKLATGRAYTFHCLRHSFAVSMYEKGMEVLEISRALGHKSLQWTSTYLATVVPCETVGGVPFTREGGVKRVLRIFNPEEEVG